MLTTLLVSYLKRIAARVRLNVDWQRLVSDIHKGSSLFNVVSVICLREMFDVFVDPVLSTAVTPTNASLATGKGSSRFNSSKIKVCAVFFKI